MIVFTVNKGMLQGAGAKIDISAFEYLTGRHIHWETREGKTIIAERNANHVALHDAEFIQGETYRHRDRAYKCAHIAPDGTALMAPIGISMETKYAEHPLEWDIVNR